MKKSGRKSARPTSSKRDAWVVDGQPAALRTSPEFWLNLQTSHDLVKARSRAGKMPEALDLVSRRLAEFGATRGMRAVAHKKK